MFDLRSLDHSTILYENMSTPNSSNASSATSSSANIDGSTASPLLRLRFNYFSGHHIATFSLDRTLSIIDIRTPGVPLKQVNISQEAHFSGLAWCTSGILASIDSAGRLCLWNLLEETRPVTSHNFAGEGDVCLNYIDFCRVKPGLAAICRDRTVFGVNVFQG